MTLKASWRVFSGPLASASLHKLIASPRFEASMNIDVGRDFLDIARGFKNRDRRRYVCKIGARLREPLFIIRNCSYDFRSL